jgi:hypothetical protein
MSEFSDWYGIHLLRNPDKHSFLCCFNDTWMFCCHTGLSLHDSRSLDAWEVLARSGPTEILRIGRCYFVYCTATGQFRLHKRRLLRGVDDYLKYPGPRIEIRALYQTITLLFRKKLDRFWWNLAVNRSLRSFMQVMRRWHSRIKRTQTNCCSHVTVTFAYTNLSKYIDQILSMGSKKVPKRCLPWRSLTPHSNNDLESTKREFILSICI